MIIVLDMNIYAIFPLLATIVYIPLLLTTASSRPWQKRHRLFALFLIATMAWGLSDYFFRSNLFLQERVFLGEIVLVMFVWMAVQFHCFTSSFFTPGQGRWLPFAYASLVVITILVMLGYVSGGVEVSGDKLYPRYQSGIIFLALPLLTLAARNFYVFVKRLRILNNPVLYNQIVSLLIGIAILVIFTLASLLPWGKEFPIGHIGSIIIAVTLSYATVRHQLVDIRLVLRRGLGWISLGIIGTGSYWFLLSILHVVLRFELEWVTMFAATLAAVIIATLIYRLRGLLFVGIGRAFQGQSYDYRRSLSDFANKIHNVFSLREQGGELLTLVTKAIGCKKACLLFIEANGDTNGGDFTAQLCEPKRKDNPLYNLKLGGNNPIVEYLRREHRPIARDTLAILPELRSLWEQEKGEITSSEIELFVPLISRDKLISILVLDKKQSGRYTLEDFQLLEEVTGQVAVSMEKEYLREQLREHEEELSIINRSSSIINSSLDIQKTYDGFINELKKAIDVDWAAITSIEENELSFLALSSEIDSIWQVGERIPFHGTATEWVANHRKPVIESDLSQESRFAMGRYYLEQGVRSIICLPLIVQDKPIGSLIVASCNPGAYHQKHVKLLEELASMLAMPIENSRLYAQADQNARFDGLTGLLNRRSLDQMITTEISRHSRYGGIFSLIILDLDSLKTVNDEYGHLAGDELLKQIGSIMLGAIRGADQAFRYGGDEFAILLPQTAIEGACVIAGRVLKRVTSEVEVGSVPVTVSLGLASWPINGIGPYEVIAAADAALYHAKRNGGNQIQRYSAALLSADDIRVGGQSSEDSETLSTIYALAATVDARDHYTGEHSKKVNEYAVALAEALSLEPLEISKLSTCALLHDVGKIAISDEILKKPDKLTDEEWKAIKVHPQLSADIVGHAPQLSHCLPGILHHHERYDGTGYPKGLKGDDIALEARILAIADAFAAMTSERPYSDALSYEQAREEMKRGAGTQFDPHLVEVFLAIVETTQAAAINRKTEYEVRR